MFLWQARALCQIRVDGLSHAEVIGGRRGFAIRDQVWGIRITCFGEMDLVAGPGYLPFGREAGLAIIRHGDQLGVRWQGGLQAPTHIMRPIVLLNLHRPPGLDGRAQVELGRDAGRVQRSQQLKASCPIACTSACRACASVGRRYSSTRTA